MGTTGSIAKILDKVGRATGLGTKLAGAATASFKPGTVSAGSMLGVTLAQATASRPVIRSALDRTGTANGGATLTSATSSTAQPLYASPGTSSTTTTVSPSSFYSGSNGSAQGNAAFIATLPVAVQPAVTMLTESGAKWLNTDASGAYVLKYSFLTKPPGEYSSTLMKNFSAFTANEKSAARAALAAWAEAANIKFTEDTASGGARAEIRFGNASYYNAPAWSYYPGAGVGGDVWVNLAYSSNATMTPGSYGAMTMAHEIGHALGLAHAGYYNGANAPATQTHAYDNNQYSIMSYYRDPDYGSSLFSARPLLNDIAAIQSMYGVNKSTRIGDSIYQWSAGAAFIDAIWDAGGNDTINASNQSSNVRIDLHGGAFSSIGYKPNGANAVDNLAIAYNAVIENAAGGAGNDSLIGNGVANLLTGNFGDDTLDGGGGGDVLQGGGGNDTYVFRAGWGQDVLTDGNGVNRLDLSAFSRDELSFQQQGNALVVGYGALDSVTIGDFFADMSRYTLLDSQGAFVPRMTATDHAPVVSASPTAPLAGGTELALSSLFTISDADGDAVVQYRVRDTGAGADTGALLKDGVVQPAGQWITIDGDLSGWSFMTPKYGGVDAIELQAFDGLLWSSVSQATLTSIDATDDTFAHARNLGSLAIGQTVSVSDSIAGSSDPADLFAFTVDSATTTGTVELALRGMIGDADLTLYDSDRRPMDTPWLSPSGDELLTINLRAGSYYLAVKPHSASESTPYSLSVTQTGGFNNAAPTLMATSAAPIEAIQLPLSLASLVKGADSDGTVLKYRVRDSSDDPASAAITWRNNGAMAAGVWYEADRLTEYTVRSGLVDSLDSIDIQAYDGKEWSAILTKQVHSNPGVVDPSLGAAIDLGVLGRNLSWSGSVALADGKPDWFKFTLPQTVNSMSLSLSGLGNDADIFLQSASFGSVGSINAGTRADSLSISGAIKADTYYIQVMGWGPQTSYTISALTPDLDQAAVIQSNGLVALQGGTSVGISSLFSITDAEGDAISQYRVRDVSVGGGTLWSSGVNIPGGGDWLTVGSLDQLAFSTPETGSTDTIELQAFDGYKWSNIAATTISTSVAVDDTFGLARSLGTLSQGTAITMAGSVNATLDPADFYSFTVPSTKTTSTIKLDLKGLGANADLILYDSNQREVARSDVAGTGDESVTFNLRSGNYYVSVVPHSQVEATSYQLSVTSLASFDNALPTLATATPAVVDAAAGETVSLARLFKAADSDGDRIAKYRVRETNGVQGSGRLSLSDGTVLAAGQWAEIDDLGSAAFHSGTVGEIDSVEVQAFDGKEWSAIAAKDVRSNPTQLDPSFGTAIDLGALKTANLTFSGDVAKADGQPDWYKFTVDTGTQFTYSLSGLTADADVFLYNASLGNPGSASPGIISESDLDSLNPGTYYIQVQGWEGRTNYSFNGRALTLNTAPVVRQTSGLSSPIMGGGSLSLSNFVSITDADGDEVSQIRMRNVSSDAGQLWLSSSGTYLSDTWSNVQNLNIVYAVPLTAGTMQLEIQAYDGQSWGDVSTVAISNTDATDDYWYNAHQIGRLTLGTPVSVHDSVQWGADYRDAWSFTVDGGPFDKGKTHISVQGADYIQLYDKNGAFLITVPPSVGGISYDLVTTAGSTYSVVVGSTQKILTSYDLTITQTELIANARPITAAVSSMIDLTVGTWTNMGTLFKATDADGDAITKYRLRTQGNSLVSSNGAAIAAGQWLEVTSTTRFKPATGISSDTIEVQAFDGKEWGDSTSAALRINATANPNLAGAVDLGALNAAGFLTMGDVALNDGAADWYKFTIDRTATVKAILSGLTADADLSLFDGVDYRTFSTRSGTQNETIDWSNLSAGTYYFQVNGWGGRTDYSLELWSPTYDLAPVVTKTFAPTTITAGTKIKLKDLISAIDPEGKSIASYSFPGLTNAVITDGVLNFTYGSTQMASSPRVDPGDWYYLASSDPGLSTLVLTASDGRVSSMGVTFNFTILPGDDNHACFGRQLGNLASTTPLSASGVLEGGADTRDWYKFSVTQAGVVDIRLSGLSADADLRLNGLSFSSPSSLGFYSSLVYAESRTAGLGDETLSFRLEAGTYSIGVIGADPTSYAVTISTSTAATGSTLRNVYTNDSRTADIWSGESRGFEYLFQTTSYLLTYRYRDLNQDIGSGTVSGQVGADGWILTSSLPNASFMAGTVDGAVDRIEVQSSAGAGWSQSAYIDVRTHVSDPNPRLQATMLSSLGHAETFSGFVASGQSQWYCFSLDAPEDVYWTLNRPDGDVNFYLYDASGRKIASYTERMTSLERGTRSLFAGTYYLEMKGLDPTHYDLQIGVNDAPVMTVAAPVEASAGTATSLAGLISALDPDGDRIDYISFKDLYFGGGYLTYNGNVYESQAVSVPMTNLSKMIWTHGPDEGTEYLEITCYDVYGASSKSVIGFTTSAAWVDQTGLGTDSGTTVSLTDPNQQQNGGLLAAA